MNCTPVSCWPGKKLLPNRNVGYRHLNRLVLLLIWLTTGLASVSKAQLYYALNDVSVNTNNDELRKISLNGLDDAQVATGFIYSSGVLAVDAASNTAFITDGATSSFAIFKINLSSGATSKFLSLTSSCTGLAVDANNGFLYYSVTDGNAITTNDQLKRIKFDGTGNELLATNFANVIGNLALDLPNNRIFATDTYINGTNSQVFAINLTSGAVTEFFNNPWVIRGLAVDPVNSLLYYNIDDGSVTTTNDELRNIGLDKTGDAQVATGFIYTPGQMVVDNANKRVLMADIRSGQPRIMAVDLTSKGHSVFFTPPTPPGQSRSLSGLALAATASPLPVSLFGFRADQLTTGAVSLTWQTGWEQNSAWFEIQRSDNAREFGTIGRVNAAGDASRQQQYSFLDTEQPAQTVYYRLRMVDIDGTSAYSSIVAVTINNNDLRLTLLGNPTRNTLRAVVNSPESQSGQVWLQTMNGQNILRQALTLSPGQTNINLPIDQVQAGLYQLIISTGSRNYVQRVLIH